MKYLLINIVNISLAANLYKKGFTFIEKNKLLVSQIA